MDGFRHGKQGGKHALGAVARAKQREPQPRVSRACHEAAGFIGFHGRPPTVGSVRRRRFPEGEATVQDGPDREFWRIAKPDREPSQSRIFLLCIAVAVVASTPWYLPAETAAMPIFGLPLWVWCALVGGLMLACCTSWAAIRCWRDGDGASPRISAKGP